MSSPPSPTSVERLIQARALLASGEARRIRLAAGLSVGQVAADIGVSASAIQRWERGERVPRTRAAGDYAELLVRLRNTMEAPWRGAD
ncbi:helix-turn-helix domain-containing protein [Geodermatophilus sp. CPCC 206100]|uniref:helix-turn-helix domain-containing protein n=1 Tax=Geodermatophilus sp. CPCC 206100 TaxID=3020054 RepID=UPI003AFFFE5A